jgi:hypothetical protein
LTDDLVRLTDGHGHITAVDMTRKPPRAQVERLRAAATARRRSALYQWMNANFDVFAATLADVGKPNWAELAKVFTEDQLDIFGKAPTGEGARLTWLRVRKTRQAIQRPEAPPAPASSPVSRQSPPPQESTPTASASPTTPQQDDPEDDPPPRFVFKPGRIK